MHRACLGFAVGALIFSSVSAGAQVVVPPGSEVPIPPKPQTDSTKKIKTDTIKAPFGRAPLPRSTDIGAHFEWDRDQLFASGAYTLADLLDRVPELTTFRTGWLASPKFAAVNGDFAKVRVFYDDVELDNVDPRSGSMLDLTTVDLWTLEHVMIERSANQIRIHLRSWRADNTDPYTRTDIYTGDENTNMYRGFYGKRWDSGAGLQLAGQDYSTRSPRFGGGGDALSFIGRFGVAKKSWSIDAFGFSRNASRTLQPTFGDGLSLPPFEGTHTLAYVRTAIGNQRGGPWAHVIASFMRLAEKSPHNDASAAATKRIIPDTTDTTTKRAQYVIGAGYTKGFLNTSAEDRIRAFDGNITHTPSVRLEFGGSRAVASIYGEHNGTINRTRGDATVRVTPIPLLALLAAASYDKPDGMADPVAGLPSRSIPKSISARLEAGVRLVNPWLIAGFVTRDTAVLTPPTVFDSAYTYQSVGRRSGLYAGLRGKLYKDVNLDLTGTRWDSAGFYQPKYQTRSEINLNTRWLRKFPSGSFGLKVAAIYEYRSDVRFPTANGIKQTGSSGVAGGLLEIRILRGVATYQVRNPFNTVYQIVPGFYMPHTISIYGLRWEFSN